jgi:predicted nucleic acid-binding protein
MCDLFQAKWSERIHDEWTRNVLKNRPDLTTENMQRVRELMNKHVQNSIVTDYESIIPSLTLPDEDDRHVLAAAIRGHADVIVTFNLKDFPQSQLSMYGLEAQHPDEFVSHLIDLAPYLVFEVLHQQQAALKNPPQSIDQLLLTLERSGLPVSISRLRETANIRYSLK